MRPTANWTRVSIALFAGGIFLVSWLARQSIDDYGARWVSGVSSAVVLIILGYEKWGWRLPVLKIISSWMGVPDLKGTWEGELRFTKDASGQPGETKFYMTVSQTLSTISIQTFFKELTSSESYSMAAELEHQITNRTRLIYTYRSESLHSQRQSNRPHDGTSILNVVNDNLMEGSYFTDRPGSGTINLRKLSTRLARSYTDASKLNT